VLAEQGLPTSHRQPSPQLPVNYMKRLTCLALSTLAACSVPVRTGGDDEPVPPDAPACDPPESGTPKVYATASLLIPGVSWQEHLAVFDPITLEVTEWISLASCADGMLDMAVDRHGRILLAGANGYYWFEIANQACITIKRSYPDPNDPLVSHIVNPPNNITFAPADLFTPGAIDTDTLVGFGLRLVDDTSWDSYEAGYLQVDPVTADTRVVTPWGDQQFAPSGDLVAVKDECNSRTRAWATVIGPRETSLCRSCQEGQTAGLDCGDCLYEFGLSDGSFSRNVGLLPYMGVFGLTFWGGTLVGFTYDGKVIKIDPTQSPPTTTEIPITLPEGFTQISFTGAGSTTIAPLL
jgi:hypothetical protein